MASIDVPGELEVDGLVAPTLSVRLYQELLEVEMLDSDISQDFPYKPNTTRYRIALKNINLGLF